VIFQAWSTQQCLSYGPAEGKERGAGLEWKLQYRRGVSSTRATDTPHRAVLAFADSSMTVILPWSTLTHSGYRAAA